MTIGMTSQKNQRFQSAATMSWMLMTMVLAHAPLAAG
jgi:hypothetical protein